MKRSGSQSNTLSPLLITNLRIPHLRAELIGRDRLIGKLDRAFDFPLTLVSAPAGFGKTTLLSQWMAESQRAPLQQRVAWLSKDKFGSLHVPDRPGVRR